MEKEQTNLSMRKDIKERAIKSIDSGVFPGICSLTALVEKALEELLDNTEKAKASEA